MWLGKKIGLGAKKIFFSPLTQNWPYLDLTGRPGDKTKILKFFDVDRSKTNNSEKKLIFFNKK